MKPSVISNAEGSVPESRMAWTAPSGSGKIGKGGAEHGPGLRMRNEANGDFRDDAQHAFRAYHQRGEVKAGGVFVTTSATAQNLT